MRKRDRAGRVAHLAACAGLVAGLAAPCWAQEQPAGEQPPVRPPPPSEPEPIPEEQPAVPDQPLLPGTPGRPPAPPPTDEEVEAQLEELREGAGAPGAPQPGPGEIIIPAFPEPVELRALVTYVAEALDINITASDALTGSVAINAPIRVRQEDLLDLLSALLEQQNFTLVRDRAGFYMVVSADSVAPTLNGEFGTTRIIPTGPVRPSAISEVVLTQLGLGTMGQPGAPRGGRIAFVDDLGVIVMTDTPRRVALVQELVDQLVERQLAQSFIRFDLEFVAASVARQRVLDLMGRGASPMSGFMNQADQRLAGLPGQALSNLSERLSVDPRGNALIFRGTTGEAEGIGRALSVIDVPNTLEPQRYFAGSAALAIAQIAQDQGLGEIEVLEIQATQEPAAIPGRGRQGQVEGLPQAFGAPPEALGGGPTMVVDPARGLIVYYGTEAQQAQMRALVAEFDVELEEVVIREYKLQHTNAEEVADIILGLLQNQLPTGDSPLMPGQSAAQNLFQRFQSQLQTPARRGTRFEGMAPQGEGEGGIQAVSFVASEDVFVIPDTINNQVLVKAPAKLQDQFARLIDRLDQRRPQVFIDVQIISVTASDTFRLAFETALVNANGRGGAVRTNFGLTSATEDITERPTVPGTLPGLTAALIDSDNVPIVIHALQDQSDTRILSSPQLLVDDNQEAAIVSIERQPFQITTQTVGNPIQTSFDYVEAGTKLTVTPSISEGGYIRLAYEIELSSFTGQSPAVGAPPPVQERSLASEAVTIPGDTTIVIGGIEVDSRTDAVVKIPLLGDIPIIGYLFRDTNKNSDSTTLYVFITPRILRDPNFRDLLLITRGPQAEVGLEPWIPELEPVAAEIVLPELPPGPVQ